MTTKISDLFPVIEDKDKEYSSNFRETLNKYTYHWPLFVLSVFIALGIGFTYLKIADPAYTIKATIIIKDDKRSPDMKEQIPEFSITNQPKIAENELEVLKSRQLVTQVVTDLGLWKNYQQKDGLKTINIYNTAPVNFNIIDSTGNVDGQSFEIKIKNNVSFYLVTSNGDLKEFHFKDVLRNGFGTWRLSPTKFLKDYIGSVIVVNLSSISKASESYQKSINAELPNKLAPVITLTLKDDNPERGKNILNHLIDLYDNSKSLEKERSTKKTLDFLDERISEVAKELNASEKKVEGYRSSQGLTDISSQSKVYLENVQSNEGKLNEVNIQLNIIENIEENLNNNQNIQNASAALGPNYPSLNSLIDKLSSLQSQKEKLLANTPEGNPVFDPINRQINSTKSDIKENVKSIKASLITARNNLKSYASKFESSIKDVPVQERQLVDKARDQTTQQNLYIFLLQRREEVSFNYASVVPNTQVVDFAYSSSAKLSASPIAYGAAVLLGLLFPIGLINSRNAISNTIKVRKEIERSTGIPVFAELESISTDAPIVALDNNNGLITEQLRSIRTNIHILKGTEKRGWVSLITSSISNEGKSFVSSNLAAVLAKSNKKTILLEMDLRRPKILKRLNLSATHPGITDYLSGNVSIDAIIQNSGLHPKLDVIGSGFISPDPSELLEQPELDALIDFLRDNYDHILIDTPPMNLVTDAKIISRFQDSIFYIIRQGYTFKSLMPFIKALKAQPGFNDIKVIFNGIEKGKYGYGQSYDNEYYAKDSHKVSLKIRLKSFFKRFY